MFLYVYFQHLLSKLRTDCADSCDQSNLIGSEEDLTNEANMISQILCLSDIYFLNLTIDPVNCQLRNCFKSLSEMDL